jgi:transcriptional regulator with PAS, ATPase and Fis domain
MSENAPKEEIIELIENPYSPEGKKPEDVVRLFYSNNVPIIPVVSKRGILIGVMRKDDVVSELSDIERVEKLKIDKFITKLARKITFDEMLNYGKIKEFVTVNIFGETQEKWSRIRLFTACENLRLPEGEKKEEDSANEHYENQALEWMIYLILEHIPRPLYALNEDGKTIFYNSHFEDIYKMAFNKEVDAEFVEKSFKSSKKNDLVAGISEEDIHFFNRDMNIFYEKIPMISKGKKTGFLIFGNRDHEVSGTSNLAGVKVKGLPLLDMLYSVERQFIVDTINDYDNLADAAKNLKISKQALQSKIKKFNIKT